MLRTFFWSWSMLIVFAGGVGMPSYAQYSESGGSGLPSWAEPRSHGSSSGSSSRMDERARPAPFGARRSTDYAEQSTTQPWGQRPGDPFGSPRTDMGNGNGNGNGNNGGASCGAGNPDNGGCQNFCTANPGDPQCQGNCSTDPALSYCDDVCAEDPNQSFCNGPVAVPIDDYLPLLVFAGIGLAMWKLRRPECSLHGAATANV